MQKTHENNDAFPEEIEEAMSLDDVCDERVSVDEILCAEHIVGESGNPNLPILMIDRNFMVVHATQSILALFKHHHETLDKPFFNIFGKCLDQQDLRNLLSAIQSHESGFSWSGTFRHKTPSATTLYTNTTFIPLIEHGNHISGYIVHFSDITREHNARLHDTFKGIMEAAKLKDNETGLHNERVGHYSKKISEYLYEYNLYSQLDPDFIENIVFLAALHDVGKIGTPDYILQKPGKLTELEWEIMREHTINGTFILASHPDPMAKEIALSHHEWWDGSGYPFKLVGEMIPLSARIVTIADVYDALRMKRTYKQGFSHEETVARITDGAGTQFDPALVDVFLTIHRDFDEIWTLMRDSDEREVDTRDRFDEFSGSDENAV